MLKVLFTYTKYIHYCLYLIYKRQNELLDIYKTTGKIFI